MVCPTLLQVGDHVLDAANVAGGNPGRAAQVAFAFRALAFGLVVRERMSSLQLSGCGLFHPLGQAAVRLHFWHMKILRFIDHFSGTSRVQGQVQDGMYT